MLQFLIHFKIINHHLNSPHCVIHHWSYVLWDERISDRRPMTSSRSPLPSRHWFLLLSCPLAPPCPPEFARFHSLLISEDAPRPWAGLDGCSWLRLLPPWLLLACSLYACLFWGVFWCWYSHCRPFLQFPCFQYLHVTFFFWTFLAGCIWFLLQSCSIALPWPVFEATSNPWTALDWVSWLRLLSGFAAGCLFGCPLRCGFTSVSGLGPNVILWHRNY